MYIHKALYQLRDEKKNYKPLGSMIFEYRNVDLLFRGLYRLQCFIRQVKFYKHIMLWHATT